MRCFDCGEEVGPDRACDCHLFHVTYADMKAVEKATAQKMATVEKFARRVARERRNTEAQNPPAKPINTQQFPAPAPLPPKPAPQPQRWTFTSF